MFLLTVSLMFKYEDTMINTLKSTLKSLFKGMTMSVFPMSVECTQK